MPLGPTGSPADPIPAVENAAYVVASTLDSTGIGYLGSALALLEKVQGALAKSAPEGRPEDRDPEEVVRTYCFALIDEVHELAKELRWKPWKKNQPINNDAVLKEFGDVLAFLGILIHVIRIRTGLDPYQLAAHYRDVTVENLDRFAQTAESAAVVEEHQGLVIVETRPVAEAPSAGQLLDRALEDAQAEARKFQHAADFEAALCLTCRMVKRPDGSCGFCGPDA